MHLAQSLAGDVGVNFRGADAGVAEEFLDHAQVGAVLHQMRGEAVSQHVRRNVARDAGALNAVLDPQPERDGGEFSAAFVQENIPR